MPDEEAWVVAPTLPLVGASRTGSRVTDTKGGGRQRACALRRSLAQLTDEIRDEATVWAGQQILIKHRREDGARLTRDRKPRTVCKSSEQAHQRVMP